MGEPTPGSVVEVAPGVELPGAALRYSYSRSGGPGGQHVNKTSSRATLTVELSDLAGTMPAWAVRRLRKLAGQRLAADPDRLVIHASDSRSQRANRRACLERLRELVVRAMDRPKRRKPTRPTRAAVERRLSIKAKRGQLKARRQRDPRED